MAEFKYPPALTPANWAKNKGTLAKAKPTGIGEALTKLSKAHESLDLTLFDADKLDTTESVERALEQYEKTAKKHFARAFEEAKTVEDVATTAAKALAKATLVPKSAAEAAGAVAKAAAEYAAALTSVRQNGVKALEGRLESLLKAQDDSDGDENAPAEVIAAKLARQLVSALKLVKAQGEDGGKPPQLFVIAAGKTDCSVFVGPRAGAGHKPLLKKALAGESGTLKYYSGQCLWEGNAFTFVGDDIPLGGFAKRLQKSLLDSTEKKYKVRVRRTSGELDEAAEDDELRTPSGSEGVPPEVSPEPEAPPTPTAPGVSEQVLTLRLKQLLPRLQPVLLKGGKPAETLKGLIDGLKLQIGNKDFGAAAQSLDALEQQASTLGTQPGTAPRQGTSDQMRDILIDKLRAVLSSAEDKANQLPGTPAYKTGFLGRCGDIDKAIGVLVGTPPGEVAGKAKAVQRRLVQLNAQLETAAVEGPSLLRLLTEQRNAFTQAKLLLGPVDVPPGSALVPAIDRIEKYLTEAERLAGQGEFGKARVQINAAKAGTPGLKRATDSYALDYPNYQIQRDLAVQAIEQLKRHAQAPAILADIQRIEAELKRIDGVAVASNGWIKATTAVNLIVAHCAAATRLADGLATRASSLPRLKQRLTEGGADTETTERLAGYALKLMVDDGCTEEQALDMARDTDAYVKAGLQERDARVSAQVCRSLTESGIPRDKALVVGKVTRASGTADASDAKAVGRLMARLSVAALENLADNGVPTECFRGGVTEVMPDSIDDIPRGWEALNLTWDNVPGMYSGSERKVFVGTMDDGSGGRKVPAKGEVAGTYKGKNISHGTDDLVGHEAGHAFDVSDGDVKSRNAAFRTARLADLAAGNLAKKTLREANPPDPTRMPADTASGMFLARDSYFIVRAEREAADSDTRSGSQGKLESACSETFAESFARYFSGTLDSWPALKAFWQTNPWGV